MHILQLIIYILCCLGVGYLGRGTRLGFWATSLVSFFVTPVLALLVLFFIGNRASSKRAERS